MANRVSRGVLMIIIQSVPVPGLKFSSPDDQMDYAGI